MKGLKVDPNTNYALNTRHWDSCWPVGPLRQPVEGWGDEYEHGEMCAACAPISYHGVRSHLWARFSHSQWESVQCRVPTFSKKPDLRSFLVSLLRQR